MIAIMEIAFWFFIFLILYTYVFYYVVLLFLASVIPKRRERNDRYRPSISFVIAAYNEKKVIEAKIRNCLSLKYPKSKLEFVFGSDHSSDKTDIIIRRFVKKYPQVKLFAFKKRVGKAGVLNKIVPRARGDLLVFSDANTMYRADSLRRMVSHFADPAVGGVCGKLVLINPNRNAGGTGEYIYWDYENRIKYLEGKIKTVFGATGGIYAIRKNLFQKLPEHKTNISDDFLIPMKIVEQGFDVIYDQHAIAQEYASLTMKDEYSRKVRIGAANVFALRKIKSLLSPMHGFVAFGLWSHKIIRWAVPFLLVMLFIANSFLLRERFYSGFFILQSIFYILGCLGWICDRLGLRIRLFSLFYYFISINLALCIGYYQYLSRTAQPTWARLER